MEVTQHNMDDEETFPSDVRSLVFFRGSQENAEDDKVFVFRWLTQRGKVMKLSEMHTTHCFNTAKMLFNHTTPHTGLEPMWWERRHSLFERLAGTHTLGMLNVVLMLLVEVERRGDLEEKYIEVHRHIISELRKVGIKTTAGLDTTD